MQRSPRPASRLFHSATAPLLFGLLALSSSACRGHHHDRDDSNNGPPVHHEREPNGSAFNADWVGYFNTGSHLIVKGHIQEGGPDTYDGFAFVAREACTVTFSLYGLRSGADLDLAVYDPFIDEFVDFWETPYNPEQGAFVVLDEGQEFHLVVNSFQYDSDYELELWGSAPVYGPSQAAPGSGASSSGNLRTSERPAGSKESGLQRMRQYASREPQSESAAPAVQDPVLLYQYDEDGRLIDVLPAVLTAVGALIATHR
jgi:hypothetical protein